MSDSDDRSDTLPKESVTRVRLVQFEKTANEPMVYVMLYIEGVEDKASNLKYP